MVLIKCIYNNCLQENACKLFDVLRLDGTFNGAILANAKSIIIAYNHPSGDLNSVMVIRCFAQMFVNAEKLIDIPVLDYVIISFRKSYYSFRDNSLMGECESSLSGSRRLDHSHSIG